MGYHNPTNQGEMLSRIISSNTKNVTPICQKWGLFIVICQKLFTYQNIKLVLVTKVFILVVNGISLCIKNVNIISIF
jgi:hypothetical protein